MVEFLLLYYNKQGDLALSMNYIFERLPGKVILIYLTCCYQQRRIILLEVIKRFIYWQRERVYS